MTSSRTRYHRVMPPKLYRHLGKPPPPAAFQMTERDWDILQLLGAFRFITAELVVTALGGSVVNIRRRLHLLWRARLVTRPPQQKTLLAAHHFRGGSPLVYELGRRGARVLKKQRNIDLRLDWTFRAGELPPLLHALDVAETMIKTVRACQAVRGLTLIDAPDLLRDFPLPTQQRDKPFTLAVTFDERQGPVTRTNTPDRLFSLTFGSERWNFAYERDRGSETVQPRALTNKKATIFRKQAVMHRAFRSDLFAKNWGFKRLRVLVHTSGSWRRVAAMLDTQHHLVTAGRAGGMFLYTTDVAFNAKGPLAPIWQSAELQPIAEELAFQTARISEDAKRLVRERRSRIERLAKLLERHDGVSILPPNLCQPQPQTLVLS